MSNVYFSPAVIIQLYAGLFLAWDRKKQQQKNRNMETYVKLIVYFLGVLKDLA